ncbi:MAG: hypothetical protein ACR2H5_20340 [Ktedonobacteraceae bacterium]
MRTDRPSVTVAVQRKPSQEQFTRVAPILGAALLLGTGGGFVLASILTLSSAFHTPLGSWWLAVAQAHGHLQLYGWAGLFVLGVAFHFLPRLRGTPLAAAWLVPWFLATQVAGLLLRVLSQPLLVMNGMDIWRVLLITSGVLECAALCVAVILFVLTVLHGPSLTTRPAFLGVLPLVVGAFIALGLATCVNLVNVVVATTTDGLVPAVGDNLNVTLGLFGFLVPIALAMSAQSLPMYAGLSPFPRRMLWPLAGCYWTGVVLICISTIQVDWSGILASVGMLFTGGVLLVFTAVFMRMMRTRGTLPKKVAHLAPAPEATARNYQKHVRNESNAYGPFVALVASAYLWAVLGSVLLVVDGLVMVLGFAPLFSIDTIRHSFAVGFVTLLICGIAPRMVPGFSGSKIMSPHLVRATLWFGNAAAALRVGSLLLAPLLSHIVFTDISLYALLFGLSGPMGLLLAACLTINLWPALWPRKVIGGHG